MYTIKKVSELVGIPTVTIRAWENRYHIITPQRSNGGHRLYNQSDIETLKWLKDQIEMQGIKISQAVQLLKQRTTVSASSGKLGTSMIQIPKDLSEALYHALVELDSQEANKTIDLAFSMYQFEDVFHQVLTPILVRLGREWESGMITVAQEHFSSELIMQRFTQFLRVLSTDPHLPKVLAFCPEGEHHHIGLLLFTLFLRKRGVEVIYLGPNTPLDGMTNLIKQKNISVLAISLTRPHPIATLKEWLDRSLDVINELTVVIGGKGFQEIDSPLKKAVYLSGESDWENWFETTFLNQPSKRLK